MRSIEGLRATHNFPRILPSSWEIQRARYTAHILHPLTKFMVGLGHVSA